MSVQSFCGPDHPEWQTSMVTPSSPSSVFPFFFLDKSQWLLTAFRCALTLPYDWLLWLYHSRCRARSFCLSPSVLLGVIYPSGRWKTVLNLFLHLRGLRWMVMVTLSVRWALQICGAKMLWGKLRDNHLAVQKICVIAQWAAININTIRTQRLCMCSRVLTLDDTD